MCIRIRGVRPIYVGPSRTGKAVLSRRRVAGRVTELSRRSLRQSDIQLDITELAEEVVLLLLTPPQEHSY